MNSVRRGAAVLVQPPFVQLNAPYPATHYLEAFLRGKGLDASAYDHSIALYRKIFSHEGLQKVFAAAKARISAKDRSAETQDQLARYFSYETLYEEWIDGIVGFLAGEDPAMAHRLAQAVELPRGARTQAFLDQRDGRIGVDEAGALATRILDDLGDFIAFTLDPEFGTVRYGERIAASRADFSEVEAALAESPLLKDFYAPLLRDFWEERISSAAAAGLPIGLVLITIPFPGCLLGALACAAAARKAFSNAGEKAGNPVVIFGGGYVSTELRGLKDTGIFDYCDFLAFDSGFGGLASILAEDPNPYRAMFRNDPGQLVVSGFPDGDSARADRGPEAIVVDSPFEAERRREEEAAIKSVFPDYRSAEYALYLRIVDSANPMHRLWSDTPWLKYGLAHGCYWKKCSFCDTELEYVADFARSSIPALLAAAEKAREIHGLGGIHFVDEAMPMAALLEFAAANRRTSKLFSFWGNVRFDRSWTQGRCELLSACGLIAVSGGIEIATERGLAMTDKGFDLPSLIETLVAMKRAGLLVHTYLIYGFPGQTENDILESAEFCRQLFASGLVDSAFWHRFVLTRHSRMYREWKDGKRSELKPIDRPWTFANNDLSFEGYARFDRYDEMLASSLAAWMDGRDLDVPLFPLPPDYVETLISQAEKRLDSKVPNPDARLFWIAGAPVVEASLTVKSPAKNAVKVRWAYRGEMESLVLPAADAARLVALINDEKFRFFGMPMSEFEKETGLGNRKIKTLLSSGLVAT